MPQAFSFRHGEVFDEGKGLKEINMLFVCQLSALYHYGSTQNKLKNMIPVSHKYTRTCAHMRVLLHKHTHTHTRTHNKSHLEAAGRI